MVERVTNRQGMIQKLKFITHPILTLATHKLDRQFLRMTQKNVFVIFYEEFCEWSKFHDKLNIKSLFQALLDLSLIDKLMLIDYPMAVSWVRGIFASIHPVSNQTKLNTRSVIA